MIPAKPASKAQHLPGSTVPAVPGQAVGLSSADPAQRVLRQFRQVFNSVKTHFQQVEKHAGLGGAQVWALAIIRDQAGVGVNDLAKAMDVRQPTASNLVRALAEQGHIEVRKEAQDRRAVQLYLRPSGTQVLQRAPGPFSGVLPKALAGLDPATLQRLELDLAVLIRALGPDEHAAAIPLGEM